MTTFAPQPLIQDENQPLDLVKSGAKAIANHLESSPRSWDTPTEKSLRRLPESWERCGTRFWYQQIEHQTPKGNVEESRPTSNPCNTRGCPRCGEYHGSRELRKWESALRLAYPSHETLLIVHMTLPALNPAKARDIVNRLHRRRSIRRSLKNTMGFMSLEEGGCEYAFLFTESALVAHLGTVESLWEEMVPGGEIWVESAPSSDPLESAVELRLLAERAPFQMVALGIMEPSEAMDAMRSEWGRNRIVFGPGFRSLAKEKSASTKEQGNTAWNSSIPGVGENDADPRFVNCNLGHPDCNPIVRSRSVWWKIKPRIDSGELQAVRDVSGAITYVEAVTSPKPGG